jgi:hypothetical protein
MKDKLWQILSRVQIADKVAVKTEERQKHMLLSVKNVGQ